MKICRCKDCKKAARGGKVRAEIYNQYSYKELIYYTNRYN